MITNFDYLKKESKFSAFADVAITAEKIILDKNPNLKEKEDVARKVGIGAIIFTYLKNGREKDIIFDWDEILSFECFSTEF